MRSAADTLAPALDFVGEFFGEGYNSGNYDHAAQRVQHPPVRKAWGRAAHDPGARMQAVALRCAEIEKVRERLVGVEAAVTPVPVVVAPMTEQRFAWAHRLRLGRY